ncbi:NACHT, LRR and PYD domains-containing protein 12-like isoform X3 [Alosa sapidissima]|uniref:NACHT, LRR and PYD domains-containing protein 12-like isoform X3 n=1 Tax=Alosa sapidissima TaxID=34773 RepID=UPI001C092B9F|nr:NACHT, LRR and PYD domains-containing protein 12-like isoform X3 [Alosa sapidissima]
MDSCKAGKTKNIRQEMHRPPSPVPSCVSMKSDKSMDYPPKFSDAPTSSGLTPEMHRPPSPVNSCVSMKSDKSMDYPPKFSNEPAPSGLTPEMHRPPSPVNSCVSVKSDKSIDYPPKFSNVPTPSGLTEVRSELIQDQSRCGVCEQLLRDPVITTCGHSCCRQCLEEQPGLPGNQACPQCGNKYKTHSFQYTDVLRRVIENHKASLRRKFENISEGINKPGIQTPINEIYTELYITEGESEGVNKEHEVWQVELAYRALTTEDTPINCNDIFKPLPGQEKNIRTVMTKGVAGIGKTVSVQKFILDWTDGVANQNVHLIFPLSFRELNLVRGDQYSLHSLLLDFHPELKELNDGEGYNDCQVVFIFDGLDESRISLHFQPNLLMSDVTQTTSLDILMASLIKGTLFPSALIWITSRPAATSQVPAQYIDQVTEVRGFNDPQKEQYFRKRICDESQANRVISHIKISKSLHIMCHIPVFCWIAATVLQQMLEQDNTQKIPKTLTEMFIHFLLIQTTRKNQKYQSGSQLNTEQLLESQKEVILKLAELAFSHLENGNVMFYEEDLKECGIDVSEASVYSGMCTEIFKEESVFHQRKVYCFVHLSIQEFLAALHIFVSYSYQIKTMGKFFCLEESLKFAITKVLESRNGHLDLFLRFLMGISLESNQRLLQGLLNHTYSSSKSIDEVCQYIKMLNRDDLSPERCINLFNCLLEMNDHSIHEEIQRFLKSPNGFKQELSPTHCSALAHMLLMSDEVMDEFDLKKYVITSDEGRRRLIPAVRCCRKAQFAGCKLSEKSCGIVATVLKSPNSLIELDLSHNDLGDSGVQLLSKGLSSPHCKLHTLRLADCKLTDKLCKIVTSVLQSPNSLLLLDLSGNDLGDSGTQLLSEGLSSSNCILQTLRLADCKLAEKSCEIVASILQLPNSLLQLDLSDNELGDSGVQLLSKGLSSSNCKIHTLRLSDCLILEKGCGFLASALRSNPFHLKEMDLSYNHPGESGLELLSGRLEDPVCKLELLKTDDASVSRTRPCLLKYACELTVDPNTAGRNLSLSDGNRKVTRASEKQLYPDHPERFDWKYQVLCRESLSGRCYWEAEWSGDAARIAVAYKSIKRKGEADDIIMGLNAKSWSLRCSPDSYSAWHNNKHTVIPSPSSRSRRVGVYLDWPDGTLSFYSVSSDTLTHLHTFHSTFTEPLCPGFWVWSSVSLCQILHLRHSVSNRKRWLLHRFYSNLKNFISTFENTSVLQPKNKIVW